MKLIWKYAVPDDGQFEIEMPRGAQLLTLQVQHEEPQLWALVDTEAASEMRRFIQYCTGQPVHNVHGGRLIYVGTYQQLTGNFVGHVFELVRGGAA